MKTINENVDGLPRQLGNDLKAKLNAINFNINLINENY